MIPETVGCVVNPASGEGRGEEFAHDLRALFPEATVATWVTEGPDEVPAATREYRDRDLLVAVGGDGTLGEVVDALPADAPPLFVVPAGRGNSAYRHFYGDRDWRAVARDLAAGVAPTPVDVGRIDADPPLDRDRFVLGFTAGLFRRALDAADSLRFLPGPVAYFLGSLRATLAEPPIDVTIDADGAQVFDGEARVVAVGGGRYRGSAFDLLPNSRPGDGRLHLLVVEPTSGRNLLRITRAARSGRHVANPAVTYLQADRLDIRATNGLPAEVDGTAVPTLDAVRLGLDAGGMTLARPE